MNLAKLDELLEQLEAERSSGREPSIEELCADCPEMIVHLRERIESHSFSEVQRTRAESTHEVKRKLSTMPENLTGHRLVVQSDLKIEEYVDRGGLGDVYRAGDDELSRDVAIKILRADRSLASNIEDFERESRIIGGLVHPGIVSIYGKGETIEGRPFYCMPFLDRGNLRTSIVQHHQKHPSRLEESDKEFRDLIYRLISVCQTVGYAHSRGIIHRDLKTENVLLGKYGETFVIDWGCATRVKRDQKFKVHDEKTLQLKGVEESTSSGGLTLRYASPEQLHGARPVGPESDIYSLGAMLYIMLTGKSPLEQELDANVRKRVIEGDIPTPDSVKPGAPASLLAVCKKAMQLEPHDRYDTALDLAEDLERYLADEPVSAKKDSVPTKLARLIRRNRTASLVLMGVLMAASLFLSLAFAGQSFFANRAQASARERLRMAATLAGNLGGFEINRRLSLLEKEATKPELIEAMQTIDDSGDRKDWVLAQNMLYEFRDDLMAAGVKLESMALLNSNGVQVARAPKSKSIGKCFAYRSYFHGLKEDLDPESPEYLAQPPSPSDHPIVSNAYVSTNIDSTGNHPIKTSFTVPIFSKPETPGGTGEVVGRLNMSIKINDLAIFDRLSKLSADAVLVETRDYTWGTGTACGLILDRIVASGPEVGVPTDPTVEADRDAIDRIKDSMARLSENSMVSIRKELESTTDAILIPGFADQQIGEYSREAACARLSIPYRSDVRLGWAVLFIEGAEAK